MIWATFHSYEIANVGQTVAELFRSRKRLDALQVKFRAFLKPRFHEIRVYGFVACDEACN